MNCACISTHHPGSVDGHCHNQVSASEYDPISLCDTCALDNSLNGECALPPRAMPGNDTLPEPSIVQHDEDVEQAIERAAEETFGV